MKQQPSPPEVPQLLDKSEAAKLLRMSPKKVEGYMIRGELGVVRLGRKVFTTIPLLADFIERNTRRPCPDPDERARSNTVAIGSAAWKGRHIGTSSGTSDRETAVELRSALTTFLRPRNGSSAGSTSGASSSPRTRAT